VDLLASLKQSNAIKSRECLSSFNRGSDGDDVLSCLILFFLVWFWVIDLVGRCLQLQLVVVCGVVPAI
jgi:hypothetical protein